MRIAPSFREGGFFEKGALLLEIDPTEYEAEVRLTEMALTQSYLTLKEEQARSQQAIRNWQRLGQQGFPSDLAMRNYSWKLQISDRSGVFAWQSKTNLERTRVVAPYAGRIMDQMVDTVCWDGTQLAESIQLIMLRYDCLCIVPNWNTSICQKNIVQAADKSRTDRSCNLKRALVNNPFRGKEGFHVRRGLRCQQPATSCRGTDPQSL